ncbi:MAG: GNAT family N-acetyltransferase [Magnetococcales bacterium]|nr:GNAT family N-acetyltransferase [Magnetococcales bacterium]
MTMPAAHPVDACQILPLHPRWQESARQIYDQAFSQADLPYGQQLPSHYLANRLFGSSLWPSDSSRILLTQAGEGVGLALANRRLNPATPEGEWLWVQLFCIVPAWQRRGLGRLLLHHLLEEAAATGKRGLSTALQWAGLWPGIPASLQAMQHFCQHTGACWRPGEIYLEMDIREEPSVPAVNPSWRDGATLSAYAPHHQPGLTALLRDHFSIGWQHEVLHRIDPAYEPFNGYGWAGPPAFHPPGQAIMVLEYQEEVVGFALLQGDTHPSTAFFGPIGLHPEWRGHGWGSRLLRAAAQRLRAQGGRRLGLWTSAALATGFYAPLGLLPRTTTRHAQWQLPPRQGG